MAKIVDFARSGIAPILMPNLRSEQITAGLERSESPVMRLSWPGGGIASIGSPNQHRSIRSKPNPVKEFRNAVRKQDEDDGALSDDERILLAWKSGHLWPCTPALSIKRASARRP